MTKARDISIDWIKFVSVFLIINSHSDIMYPKFSILATGGAIGDCLFLFISGYTLWLNRSVFPSFANWYKRRINRIYPTVIVWVMIACAIGCNSLKCRELILGGGEFVNAIMIYYIALYFIRKYLIDHLKWVYGVIGVIVLMVYWLWFPYKYEVSSRGIYGVTTQFRWLPYFLFMLMGAHIGQIKDRMRFNLKWDVAVCFVCLALFYSVQFLSKKYPVVAPYQIFTLLPLAGVVIYFYKICNAKFLARWYEKRWVQTMVMTMGGLCLESYLIQYSIITDKLNFLFPLNLPIITLVILVACYFVRCLSRIFAQTFDSKDYDWKKVFAVV